MNKIILNIFDLFFYSSQNPNGVHGTSIFQSYIVSATTNAGKSITTLLDSVNQGRDDY